MPLLVFSVLFLLSASLGAQGAFFIDETSIIDPDRYNDIKGSPYYWKEWPVCTLIDGEDKSIKGVEVNLNGFTGNIEVRKSGRMMELDMDFVKAVTCALGAQTIGLKESGSLSSKMAVVLVHHQSDRFTFIEEFWVGLSEKTFNNYGETRVVKRFSPKNQYALFVDGLRNDVKLKTKDFIKLLPDSKKTGEIIDQNNLKMKDLSDYIFVLGELSSNK